MIEYGVGSCEQAADGCKKGEALSCSTEKSIPNIMKFSLTRSRFLSPSLATCKKSP
jgi:hypothetical protein